MRRCSRAHASVHACHDGGGGACCRTGDCRADHRIPGPGGDSGILARSGGVWALTRRAKEERGGGTGALGRLAGSHAVAHEGANDVGVGGAHAAAAPQQPLRVQLGQPPHLPQTRRAPETSSISIRPKSSDRFTWPTRFTRSGNVQIVKPSSAQTWYGHPFLEMCCQTAHKGQPSLPDSRRQATPGTSPCAAVQTPADPSNAAERCVCRDEFCVLHECWVAAGTVGSLIITTVATSTSTDCYSVLLQRYSQRRWKCLETNSSAFIIKICV